MHLHADGHRPTPTQPPPIVDPGGIEPRPEPITELPVKPPAQEPPETPPAPRKLL